MTTPLKSITVIELRKALTDVNWLGWKAPIIFRTPDREPFQFVGCAPVLDDNNLVIGFEIVLEPPKTP